MKDLPQPHLLIFRSANERGRFRLHYYLLMFSNLLITVQKTQKMVQTLVLHDQHLQYS